MTKRVASWENLPKRNYYLVKNKLGHGALILAETEFEAIAIAQNRDGFKYERNTYTAKKTK